MPDPVQNQPDPNANPNQNPSGDQPQPWFTDQQKPFVEAKGWKSPTDVLTSYENLEKLIGADKANRTIVKPKDDKDVEGQAAFRAALGVPKDVTGYKLPDTMKDDPTAKGFADLALKTGMTPQQFEGVMAWVGEMTKTQQDELNKEVARVTNAALDGLKAEWGTQFAEKSEFAKRFARESGWSDKEIEAIERSIGTKRLLEQFFKHGASMGEARFSGNSANDSGSTPQKQALQKQIDALVLQRRENPTSISQQDYINQMERLQNQKASAA